MAGVQCLKRLYLEVHAPELARGSDEAAKDIIEQGRQVGLVAQKAFPGGVTVDVDHLHLEDALRTTRELVENAEVPAIFEATFQHDGVLVRTDILERCTRLGLRLIEVKSSTDVKPQHAYDLSVQHHVLSGSGIQIDHVSLMHLDRDYVFEGNNYDVPRLFKIVEQQPGEIVGEAEISDRLREQFRILNQPTPPDVKPGRQCEHPVLCEFYDHCNQELPSDHVSLLPRIRAEKLHELMELGITSIKQIPDDFSLSEKQRRITECVKSGKMFVSPELARELSALCYPICFMDFETIFPALPQFAGMAPYDHIPFQWSVHRQEQPNDILKHYEFLAENNSDPRIQFIESLGIALKGANSVVVFNQSFERARLDDLARWLPAYASTIGDIKARLWDLLTVVRQHVYHPDFGGSFSLKKVLPALVNKMNYETLEVADGAQAGLAWIKSLDPAKSDGEKQQIRRALSEYCGQDTLGLARLVDVLRGYANVPTP